MNMVEFAEYFSLPGKNIPLIGIRYWNRMKHQLGSESILKICFCFNVVGEVFGISLFLFGEIWVLLSWVGWTVGFNLAGASPRCRVSFWRGWFCGGCHTSSTDVSETLGSLLEQEMETWNEIRWGRLFQSEMSVEERDLSMGSCHGLGVHHSIQSWKKCGQPVGLREVANLNVSPLWAQNESRNRYRNQIDDKTLLLLASFN